MYLTGNYVGGYGSNARRWFLLTSSTDQTPAGIPGGEDDYDISDEDDYDLADLNGDLDIGDDDEDEEADDSQ